MGNYIPPIISLNRSAVWTPPHIVNIFGLPDQSALATSAFGEIRFAIVDTWVWLFRVRFKVLHIHILF